MNALDNQLLVFETDCHHGTREDSTVRSGGPDTISGRGRIEMPRARFQGQWLYKRGVKRLVCSWFDVDIQERLFAEH